MMDVEDVPMEEDEELSSTILHPNNNQRPANNESFMEPNKVNMGDRVRMVEEQLKAQRAAAKEKRKAYDKKRQQQQQETPEAKRKKKAYEH